MIGHIVSLQLGCGRFLKIGTRRFSEVLPASNFRLPRWCQLMKNRDSLIDLQKGETKAHACANACFRKLSLD